MEFKVIFYIIIAVIFVGSKIFQGIKKANEELKERQKENAKGPRPQQQPTTESIPDPWQQPKPQPTQQKKQKTIEEILEEMTRQYDKPTATAPTPPAPKPSPRPAPKRDQLGQPYPELDNPYSKIDLPIPEVKKNYRFDDNMAMSSLTKKDYTNILEENDTLDDSHDHDNEGFSPREAFKYATLLERKYQ